MGEPAQIILDELESSGSGEEVKQSGMRGGFSSRCHAKVAPVFQLATVIFQIPIECQSTPSCPATH